MTCPVGSTPSRRTTPSGSSSCARPPQRRGWATVNQLMQDLFRERSWSHMAESETYAHLEHLRYLGDAERREEAGYLLVPRALTLPVPASLRTAPAMT